MGVPFAFAVSHTLVLIDDFGVEAKFYIHAIREDGWMLAPHERPDERLFHSGPAIERYHNAGRLRYEPWNDEGLKQARRRRLRADFRAEPDSERRAALRKLRIVRECLKELALGMPKGKVLEGVPKRVIENYGKIWHSEDTERARADFQEREAAGLVKLGEHFEAPAPPKTPHARTVWTWLTRYCETGNSINALLNNHADKGRRESQLKPEQDAAIDKFLEERISKLSVLDFPTEYRKLCKRLKSSGVAEVSAKAFKRRIERKIEHRSLLRKQSGVKETRRRGVISRNKPALALWPGHQVEMDHTLFTLDAVDDDTGTNLGRPWVTALRCRATTYVVGAHIGFLSPSWATSSRAIMQAMWQKDLSSFPSIENEWHNYGPWAELITDRGTDFISDAGRDAAAENRFEIVNVQSGAGWLKGGLERWNGVMKSEVLTYFEGTRYLSDREYNGKKVRKVFLSEIVNSFRKYIVDDHLHEARDSLNGLSANDVYQQARALHGPPPPIYDFPKFRRMSMMKRRRKIQPDGVEISGYFYRSEELRTYCSNHNYGGSYDVWVDPWDVGYIEIVINGRFVVLFNECPELCGVTHYRSEIYWDEAKAAIASDQKKSVTIDGLLRAKERVDDDAERVLGLVRRGVKPGSQKQLGQFLDLGRFLTPVPLRPVWLDTPPVDLPGFYEVNGILRPGHIGQSKLFRPTATGAALAHADPVDSPNEIGDLSARIAAGARARASRMQ